MHHLLLKLNRFVSAATFLPTVLSSAFLASLTRKSGPFIFTGRLRHTVIHHRPSIMAYSQGQSRASSNSGGRGRGEYYRNKYGGGRGGGRGSGGRGPRRQQQLQQEEPNTVYTAGTATGGGSFQSLTSLLQRIDGRPYPAYHDLETASSTGWINEDIGFTLQIGRTQSDPFAPPTRCRVTVPYETTQLPVALFRDNKIRCMALADYLWRQLYHNCKSMGADHSLRAGGGSGGGWKGSKGGDIQVMEPTQHVMEQTAVWIDDKSGNVTCQITVNLPARGRTILGNAAAQILDPVLSQLVHNSFKASLLNLDDMKRHVESIEDQVWLQNQLDGAGLVAFIPNGAILPRRSGVDDRPMQNGNIVAFQSPARLETSFALPNTGETIVGMGIPKGITIICGGGFHGKSTLLECLQLAVYSKIPGDGREFCVTTKTASKIRAEDGRSIQSVDISSFINNLPFGQDTTCFSTMNASGSTSQASNIVEAIEMGADALLIDEDSCATNLMIRDEKMMQLVACEKEPITPFIRVVGSLKAQGVSTVLVVGASGDFFDVADHVLLMDCYRCDDATERAKQIAEQKHTTVVSSQSTFAPIHERFVQTNKLDPRGKVKILARNIISYGDTEIELSDIEQLVSKSQVNAIAAALQLLAASASGQLTVRQALQALETSIDEEGLDILGRGQFNGSFMKPRLLEMSAAVNRLRRDCIYQNADEMILDQ